MTFEKTVLIVEDDGIVAMDIEEELVSRGWHTIGAVGSLDSALRLVDKQIPALAVLDINLRGKTSYDLASKLRGKGVSVVFLSGNSATEVPDDLKSCAFVPKPVNYDLLQDTMYKIASGTRDPKATAS